MFMLLPLMLLQKFVLPVWCSVFGVQEKGGTVLGVRQFLCRFLMPDFRNHLTLNELTQS
jgi:hypothetical protein